MSFLTEVFAPLQALMDEAALLAAAVRAFSGVSWPYMGSDWPLVGSQVEGLDSTLKRLCHELTRLRSGKTVYAVAAQPAELPAVEKLRQAERQSMQSGLPRSEVLHVVGEFFSELRGHALKLLKLVEQAKQDELKNAPQPVVAALEDARARLDAFVRFETIYGKAGGLRVQLDGLLAFAALMQAPEQLRQKLAAAAKALA